MTIIELHPNVNSFLKDKPKKLLINGEFVAPAGGKTIKTYNPSDGSALVDIAGAEAEDVDLAVTAARLSAVKWGATLPYERENLLRSYAALIEEHGEELAQLESLDNGKPIQQTRLIDSRVASNNMIYWAGWPSHIQGEAPQVSIPDKFVYTRREPVGVVALIIPWNYPLTHFTQKVGPALAAGNSVIIKPASNASLAVLRLGELAVEAGFPPGVINILTGSGRVTGEALSSHPQIDKIQITGSTAVGKQVIQNSAINIKRLSLELGSKAPNCIFADADLDKAIQGAFHAAFGHTGQSCVAGSRLYVERPVYERVLQGLISLAQKVKVGHALDTDSEMGPVVDPKQFETIMNYIEDGVRSGATLAYGGKRLQDAGLPSGGFYLPPTIFTGASDDARISREEIFGPVVTIYPFEGEEELVRRANDTTYGLAAALWTQNLPRAHRIAAQIKAGVVWINTYDMFSPNVPFGGFKQSGYGRDNGLSAIEAVTEVKAIWISTK